MWRCSFVLEWRNPQSNQRKLFHRRVSKCGAAANIHSDVTELIFVLRDASPGWSTQVGCIIRIYLYIKVIGKHKIWISSFCLWYLPGDFLSHLNKGSGVVPGVWWACDYHSLFGQKMHHCQDCIQPQAAAVAARDGFVIYLYKFTTVRRKGAASSSKVWGVIFFN